MADAEFVPFVPRRIGEDAVTHVACPEPAMGGRVEMTEPSVEPEPRAKPEAGILTPPEHPEGEIATTEPSAPLEAETRIPELATSRSCHAAMNARAEAIRLAAIACGRALRHAVVLHPRVIAGFVDDAIAAAGRPRSARIRVHPDAIPSLGNLYDGCVADESLELGDVIVEGDGTSLGAVLVERARLLVSAAAEA